jgi:hypothetical protein
VEKDKINNERLTFYSLLISNSTEKYGMIPPKTQTPPDIISSGVS